ncbi:MAG TPA: hypothetical protein VIQ30_10830 [Pseudonocardia sp.]
MTTFRSFTLVVAVLLLAGGALTGFRLLHTTTSAPLPAQLSTSDSAGQPGSVPPVEQIPPAAPQVAPTTASPGTATPGTATPGTATPKRVPTNPAPAQRTTTTAPDRTSGSGDDRSPAARGSYRDFGRWHDPDGFPRRDQYPFRPRAGFGQNGPGFGNRPGQAPTQTQTQTRAAGPSTAPTEGDRARQQVADAICDRYHLPREQCQIDSTGR